MPDCTEGIYLGIEHRPDNPRVLVTKLRYDQSTFVDPLHLHPNDTVVVYLNAGYSFKWGEPTRLMMSMQYSVWSPW